MILDISLVTGLCCYNSSSGLPYIFKNLDKLKKLFNHYSIIFCYDKSIDNTLELLRNYQKDNPDIVKIIFNRYPRTNSRTNNISNARNSILEHIVKFYSSYDYFSMMDSNEYSCIGEIVLEPLIEVFSEDMIKEWDAISFNREAGYYDHWALSFHNYIYSFFHCSEWQRVVENLRNDFNKLLDNNTNKLIYVYSAFNGFSIYKMNKFIDCQYSSNIELDLFPRDELEKQCSLNKCYLINKLTDDCEHRKFHLQSIRLHNSKIAIYNKSIFKKIYPTNPSLRGPA